MLHLGLGRASSLGCCGLLAGDIFRGAAFWDLEAEGVADVHLSAHERGDELQAPTMLDTADGAHLREDVLGGVELVSEILVALVDMTHV